MQVVLRVAAGAWFVIMAVVIGDGRVGTSGAPPNEEVLGDPTVMAIHLVGRLLFVGLGLLSLSMVEWDRATRSR